MANALNVKIGGDISGLQKALSNATVAIQNVGRQMTQMGKTMSTRVTAPIVAGFGFAIKAASDAEETIAKFATVFKDVEKESERAFRVLRNEYGLSSTAAKELLGNTGDLLTGFGFTGAEALRLSEEVNKLAVDLASFTNFSGGAEGASAALTKALLGERESVKALGISILEEDVKKQMAINTAKGLTFATERQAKAQATLDLAIQQSQNAIGDYARTSDSFANQMRLLRARTNDLAVEFGTILLPAATKALTKIQDLVARFMSLDDATKRIILRNALLVASIGPAILVLGKLTQALALVLTPIFAKIAALGALVLAFEYVRRNLDVFINRIQVGFATVRSVVIKEVDKILEAIQGWAKWLPGNMDLAVMSARASLSTLSTDIPKIEGEFQGFGEFLTGVLADIGNGAKRLGEILFSDLVPAMQTNEGLSRSFDAIGFSATDTANKFAEASVRMVSSGESIRKMMADTITTWDEFKFQFKSIGGEMKSFLAGELSSAVLSFGDALGRSIAGADSQWKTTFEKIILVVLEFANSLAKLAGAIGGVMVFIPGFQGIGAGLLAAALALQAIASGFSAGIEKRAGNREKRFTSVNDALIMSNGNIVKFHPDDNILAMKDFSNLGGGSVQKVIVEGMINGKDILLSNARSERSFR